MHSTGARQGTGISMSVKTDKKDRVVEGSQRKGCANTATCLSPPPCTNSKQNSQATSTQVYM